MIRVGLYDDPAFREHDSGDGHPERPERLDALRRGIRDRGLEERLELVAPSPASREELLRAHSPRYVDLVASTEGHTVRFDPDTQAGPRSYRAALKAAGAVVDAVDRVLGGSLDRAFCLPRPPGHHALQDSAMGFCLFNNVAVGAAHALARGLTRVAIIDWDVHHGNGTQAIFEEDPRVLYVSSHQYPFYPGTGALEEVGRGAGTGFTVNLPLPAGLGDEAYRVLYETIVEPVGRAFSPELVIVSVGFDPHRDDPLAGMQVTDAGFACLAASCLRLGAPTVFVLEGGYDLEGIATSGGAVAAVLLGDPPPRLQGRGGVFEELFAAYRRRLKPLWPSLED